MVGGRQESKNRLSGILKYRLFNSAKGMHAWLYCCVLQYLTEAMQHRLDTAWVSAEFELGMFLSSEFVNHRDVAMHARHEHRET